MERETTDRGGTEPLAALVSVAAVCVAVSVYAGFASVTIAESGDDGEIDRATLDSVWTALAEDGILNGNNSSDIETQLGPEILPRGHRVAVTATIVGPDGHLQTVANGTFGADANVAVLEPPPSAAVRDRPVAVRVAEGDIRPGRLRVVVWDG